LRKKLDSRLGFERARLQSRQQRPSNHPKLYRLRKNSIQGLVLKGHDFSRANKAHQITPGLYRLRKSSIQGLVLKGHDFSRANKANRICWALAPAGWFFEVFKPQQPFSAACFRPRGMFSQISTQLPAFHQAFQSRQ
ncbi:MAG: hypothetical protein P4M10_03535, partial [Verrucomicrobiae bacterium]|nr:hypothetical protein [Verrucomicrobiae bacterium]